MMMRGQPQNMTLPMNNEINDHLSPFYKVRFWLYVLGEQAEFTQRSKSFTELPLSALATSALLPNTLLNQKGRTSDSREVSSCTRCICLLATQHTTYTTSM